jgi:DNA replication protein DnaC
MSTKNALDEVRPESTFANYVPKTPSQTEAAQIFQKVAGLIIEQANNIRTSEYPFPHARLLSFFGGPGRGKSHLMEALVNDILQQAPDLKEKIFLLREDFTNAMRGQPGAALNAFDGKPIILIDDLFSECQSVEDLHPKSEVMHLMRFIAEAYERRPLIITTSNFPFVKGIIEKIQEVDTVGRATSRCDEILSRGGEVEIAGPDGRIEIASNSQTFLDELLEQTGAEEKEVEKGSGKVISIKGPENTGSA